VVTAAGIMGIVGAKKKIGALLIVFEGLLIIFFFVFFGTGIAAFVIPKDILNGDCVHNNQTNMAVAL
jgi:hypothetical protein